MCLNKIAIAQYFHVKLYFFFVSVDNWHLPSTVQIQQSVPTTSLLWGGSMGTPSLEEISCGSICGSLSWVGLIGGPFPGTFPRPRELWLTAAQCFFFWSCHILSVQSSLALFDSRWLNVYWKGRKWTRSCRFISRYLLWRHCVWEGTWRGRAICSMISSKVFFWCRGQ